MTPEQLAAPGTEHAHQVALFCWIATQIPKYPELRWAYATPNGGKRDPITAARLKAEGVKSGISDICLPFSKQGYHGFYIEMKKPKGKESPEQKDFGAFLTQQGYLYTMCDSWDKARDAIQWYVGQQVLPLEVNQMILTDKEKDAILRKVGILANLETLREIVDASEKVVLSKLAGVSVEPVTSDNPDFITIPVEYQYAYPDGTWRCSNGDAINGMKPTAARALYARKDSQ